MPAKPPPRSGRSVSVWPWRSAGVAVLLLLVPLLLWHLPFFRDVLAGAATWHKTPLACLWFLLLAVPYCAVGLSRQALCVAAGLGFGLWEGLLLSNVAYVVGALLSYSWVRVLASSSFKSRHRGLLEERSVLLARMLHESPFCAVLTLRLMPVGSALLVSMAAGLLELSLPSFVLATLLGGLPQNVVFVLIGAGTRIGQAQQLIIAAALFLGSAFLGRILYRRHQKVSSSCTPS